MYEEKIRTVVERFAEEVKGIFGMSVQNIILYGSCARGDFGQDSDIDIMVLANREDTEEQILNVEYVYKLVDGYIRGCIADVLGKCNSME